MYKRQEDACICMKPCKERCTCASLRSRAMMPGLLKTCIVRVPMQCDDACFCMEPCKERCTCASLRFRATMPGLARHASCVFRCSAKMPALAWSRARNAALLQICGPERRRLDFLSRASCMFRCSAKMPASAWSRGRNAVLVQVCGSERRCSDLQLSLIHI